MRICHSGKKGKVRASGLYYMKMSYMEMRGICLHYAAYFKKEIIGLRHKYINIKERKSITIWVKVNVNAGLSVSCCF